LKIYLCRNFFIKKDDEDLNEEDEDSKEEDEDEDDEHVSHTSGFFYF